MTPCAITPLRTDGVTMAADAIMNCADPRRGPTHYDRIGVGVSNEFLKSMEGRKFSTPDRFWKPVRFKQVRGLAVAGAKRFPDELELPTVAEGGRIRL
jgi:hypothetical protein